MLFWELTKKIGKLLSRAMEHDITPQVVRDAATKSLITLGQFLKEAGVSTSTFYRWQDDDVRPRPLTLERLRRAVNGSELGHFGRLR